MPLIRHLVYECLPGAYAGGVQKMVFELASAQRRLGADVEIWTVDATRGGKTEIHGGLVIRYFNPDYALGYVRSASLIHALDALPKDVVLHAHNTFHPLNHDVAVAARRLGLRHFFHPHGALDPILFAGWSLKSVKKRLYHHFIGRPDLNRATGVFALTPLEAEQLAELGVSGTTHVVPNGITPVAPATAEAIAAFCSGHRVESSSKIILFIGRIMPKKKLEDIIVAFANLRVDFPELLLAIAGNVAQDSAYHRRLVALAIGLGCADQIRWLGFLDEQAKPAALASAAVFVHASESEGMALAILEAMSAGLPIVVSKGCYMREAGAAGALLECAQGPEALAISLRQVLDLSPPAARLSENARAYAAKEHDWSRLAARTLEIYSK
jgi:glycosyltransferase involved in cell wall biosynthesis